jgi:site-specific DNA-methyltransferase (cytosine-N4-specific)
MDISKWKNEQFSADYFCPESARLDLENKYFGITEVTDKFNRQSVSYQLSKKDYIHRWLKYKEGFSAELVENLLDEIKVPEGGLVLDPFLGSGTTALVCKFHNINSIGFDIMPMTGIAVEAKANVFIFDINELQDFCGYIKDSLRPSDYNKRAKYINITNAAYPSETELDLSFFTELIETSRFSNGAINLVKLCLINSLERLSYTAKDGQYLRWDIRSQKVMDANLHRIASGKEPLKVVLDKGELPSVKTVLIQELTQTIKDIRFIQQNDSATSFPEAKIDFRNSSALLELPTLDNDILDGVITSPPYCNRYDYTRIYALELVYLGMGEDEVRKLRQDLLTCTVESKPKLEYLKDHYDNLGKIDDYRNILQIIQQNKALNEVINALLARAEHGDINNIGVLKMVKGYFEELAFIYYELFRTCKSGASVAFVNDNVRYAGEVIPVDFISTDLAQQIGFVPKVVYTLKQQKGNSSQQMKKFGRVALRKSITIWQKP